MKLNGDMVSPLLTPPLTPQTHAARVLARIGDEVRAKYELQLDDALYRLFLSGQETFSYEVFRDMACQIVDHNLPGWRQVRRKLIQIEFVWHSCSKDCRVDIYVCVCGSDNRLFLFRIYIRFHICWIDHEIHVCTVYTNENP